MPKKVAELGALQVGRLVKPGAHAVGGVAGLQLKISPDGARSWVLRAMVSGKRRDMGLGGFPDVPLAEAKQRARDARALIYAGGDPIQARRETRSAVAAATAKAKTFDECSAAYIKAKSGEWANAKHRYQWETTLESFASPVIGGIQVSAIEVSHVLAVLEPIWHNKTETASRLRGRIETVLDFATARGYRTGENPARWRGHLDQLLARPKKLKKIEHLEALPIDDVAAFLVNLHQVQGASARALEFAVLTAGRSAEIRGARWPEIDLAARIWTVPAERMKAKKEHRVPLSTQAMALLTGLTRSETTDLLFPGRKGELSQMSMIAVMRRMELSAVPHGFRSTFRDWVAERTHYPRDLAEMALAHAIESAVEAAYRRGDMLAKRAAMMQDWADFAWGSTEKT